MQSSSETQRNLLRGDVKRTSGVVSALQREKLLTGMLLKESKDELSYAQDFLDGHYKFTFLIQGDPQVGKTTLLNVLLDDALIPSSGHNAIIVVQYDQTQAIPALFTARLNEIFNSEKQIFVIKPENLKDTGLKGGANIRAALKHSSKAVNSLSESVTMNSLRTGKSVFVIKYRIPWLKELIADEFILNRIQFVDIDMPPENNHNPEDILRLEKITSSPDHGNIFVADGTKLFTIDTAAKYKELSETKEKSLLVINRSDLSGPKAHLQKIQRNQSRLCSKLNMESIKAIEEVIEEYEDTEEMRREIYLQSFYEDQGIDEDKLTEGDVIYFVSALFAFNKILLCKYENCKNDGEKVDLCTLFEERNCNNKVCQNNKRRATEKNLDILQYYLKEESDMYQNNFESVKMAVSNIAEKRFDKLSYDLFKRVKEVTAKILDCQSYLTDALSEHEIQELRTLRKQIKDLFEKRSKKIKELFGSFQKKIVDLLETFVKTVKEINTDFYAVKANHANELSRLTKNLEEKVAEAEDGFEQDYRKIEQIYKDEINNLDYASKTKKHMNYYITHDVRPDYKTLEDECQSLVKVLKGISSWAANSIITFINDDKESNKITNVLRIIAKFFGKTNTTRSFESRVSNAKSTFEETTVILTGSHFDTEETKMDEYESHFTDYLNNGKGGSLEKAREIIKEHYESQKSI